MLQVGATGKRERVNIKMNHRETECETVEWIRMNQWLGSCEDRTETLSYKKGWKHFDCLSIKLVREDFVPSS
jgi:hypothetical protein